MILWLKRYRKQKIRNIILYFVVLSIFVWKIGYDLDSQMHPEGRSMTVRFAFYVQKWLIHKEKLTSRKSLQMVAGKRILKGVFMSIRVLFICHGNMPKWYGNVNIHGMMRWTLWENTPFLHLLISLKAEHSYDLNILFKNTSIKRCVFLLLFESRGELDAKNQITR